MQTANVKRVLRHGCARLGIALLSMSGFGAVQAGTTTAEQMMDASACTDCLEWRISGLCFWLRCTGFSCSIETSVRVSHFVPDFVVTSYASGHTPWLEMLSVTSSIQSAPGAMANTPGTDTLGTRFKKTEVFGNPGILLFEAMHEGSDGLICESAQTPWMPYYISGADNWFWSGEMSLFENLTNPQKILQPEWLGRGNGFTGIRYGSTWPRCGFLAQAISPKAAAVMAHRAAHVVTLGRSGLAGLRIFQEASDDCDEKCWPPGVITTNDNDNHKWQMLTPLQDDDADVFGVSANWENAGRHDHPEGRYAWLLWRPYSCCEPEGSFLFSIDL
jgi:integrating conjugative element protein (TIGR03756 family)